MVVGRIENLMPIGVPCWAVKPVPAKQSPGRSSSAEDVERAIRAIAVMQKLDCFQQQFGPVAANRLEKPLAAAKRVLQ